MAQLVASVSGVVLGGVAEVVGSKDRINAQVIYRFAFDQVECAC